MYGKLCLQMYCGHDLDRFIRCLYSTDCTVLSTVQLYSRLDYSVRHSTVKCWESVIVRFSRKKIYEKAW